MYILFEGPLLHIISVDIVRVASVDSYSQFRLSTMFSLLIIKVKLSLLLIKVHAINAYGRVGEHS
jgi:hypothetical protein